MKLHIGGTQAHEGWKVLDVRPAPHVDFVGSCAHMPQIASGSVEEIYASHVFEHLGHRSELLPALMECHRVLRPDGILKLSVPDLVTLSKLFADRSLSTDQRYELMLMMFGGQRDEHDFHKVGLYEELLSKYLQAAEFRVIERVPDFGLFEDSSRLRFAGVPISLNMTARK